MTNIRNIAIIAHVDHGKTTLVDKMIHVGNVFGEHEKPGQLIMDHNELERERGITILAKNLAVHYKNHKINIIDTPGHSDFGGEVERVMNMADGVLLLVDAFEGPMPQTRFVLEKALTAGLKPIVVINKVDKENCTPEEVHEAVFDLMFELGATEEQLDFQTVYGSAKNGWMSHDWKNPTDHITPLMDVIIDEVPPPKTQEGPFRMLITSLDHSPYIGRIAIGKIKEGEVKSGQRISLIKRDGSIVKGNVKEVFTFNGLNKEKAEGASSGDICALAGIDGFEIGDTISDPEQTEALPAIKIDEPTMSMLFTINDSPFFGKEGKYVTSNHLKERLFKEPEKNLALRVEQGSTADAFRVYGRGVLHLSILIETMRREGYEMQIGQPRVIIKEIDGIKCEPMEELRIDLPEEHSGKAIEQVNMRKGEMKSMTPKGERMVVEFSIPSRGIIGLRTFLMTATSGEAIMTHRFTGFEPIKGEIGGRQNGSLISMETGKAIPYSLNNLQDRGTFFVDPNESIYEGQVVGENSRPGDLTINITKTKKLTNMRSAGADDKLKIAPATKFSLEEALEYIQGDEYVETTPKSLRIRKVYLKEHERKKAQKAPI